MNLFYKECRLLVKIFANMFGMTYETFNIVIFCIIGPIFGFILLYIIYKQYSKIKLYQRQIFLLKSVIKNINYNAN